MANLNQCLHIGRLVHDPEITQTPSGKTIAYFTLAITEKTNGTEITDYLDFKAWSPLADTLGKYCTKGREIFVQSKARQERWQDKQTGKQRSRINFLAQSVQFLGSRPADQEQPRQQHYQQKANGYPPQTMPHENDDDCPF